MWKKNMVNKHSACCRTVCTVNRALHASAHDWRRSPASGSKKGSRKCQASENNLETLVQKGEKKMHWNLNRTESIQTWKCCEFSKYSEQRKLNWHFQSKIKGCNWLWMNKDGRWLISITSNVTDGSIYF